MGSDNDSRPKVYNRYNCFNCGPCNKRDYYSCDNCSCSCCVDCMSSHRELFNLNDDFTNKLDYVTKDLCKKCDEIKNNLSHSYNIYFYCRYSSFNNINQCKEFLDSMKEIKDKYENRLNNSEIPTIKRDFENTINNLRREHETKLNILLNEFLKKKEKYKINENQEKVINKYENEERSKAETEFNKNKNEINQKYPNIEEKLEYTEDELKLKQQYIEEIQKIKPYTNNPIFNNFIYSAQLYKYL